MIENEESPTIGVRLPLRLIATLDNYRNSLPYPPTRATVLRRVIQDWADGLAKPRVPLEERRKA
jgi:hypothetical protein